MLRELLSSSTLTLLIFCLLSINEIHQFLSQFTKRNIKSFIRIFDTHKLTQQTRPRSFKSQQKLNENISVSPQLASSNISNSF